ncbi:tape measure protein, partial [Haemophilus haemolyticus]|uniref:tape measure protein n=1 Tax=Haemophilus haemolyticus TaxID=726 RepID=UPI000A8B0433
MADFAQLGIELRSIGVDKVNRDIRSVTDNAKSTERSVQSLLGVMGKLKVLMTAGLGIQGLGQFIQMSDKMKTLAAQVKFVTNSFEEYKAVQSQLFSISQRTRADLEATTTIYARSARALKDYGYSQERILTFTETLNKAMAVGGVGAQEQASALFQLSQALGSGRLQGDEFRTIAESAPIILDVVAQYMGKTRSEVKQLASEGKITSQLLFEAITGATEKISADFEKMPLTFGQAMTQLKNQTLKFVDDVGNRSGIFDGMAASVSFLAKNIDYLSVVIGSVLLGQLGKASVAGIKSVLTKRQEALAALEVAQATSVQATAELRLAQIQMQSLRAQLSLAQSEQTRMALRGQMAAQASQLTVLMNAEREATERAALAKQKLSLAGRASSGVLSLLGGPIGLVTTALTLGAGAFYTWKQNAEQAKMENLDYAKSLDVTSDALQKLTANQLEAMSAKLKRSMAEQKNQIQSLIEEKSRMERALSIQTKSMDEGNLWQNQYALKRYNQLLEDLKIKKGEIDSANQQLAKSERDLKSIGAEESVQRLKESVEKLYPELQFNKDKFVELKLSTEDFKDLLPDANGKILGMADALAQAAQKARLLLSGVIGVKEETAGIGADAQKVIDDLRLDRKIANAKTPQERAAGETEKYIKRLSEQGKYSKSELDAIEKEYQANALARENRSSGAKGSGNKVDYVKQYTDQVTQLQQRLADIKANLQDGGISQYQELKKLTNDIAANGEKYAHFGAEGLA